jgi:hypothetical protein
MALKDYILISVNPRYLVIATDHRNHTIARLIVPLRSDYLPERARWQPVPQN